MKVQFNRGTRFEGRSYAPGDVAEVPDTFGRWLCRSHKARQVQEPEAPALTTTDAPAATKPSAPPAKKPAAKKQ